MKERPILFSGPMVRALLDGTKTQTRRIAKVRNALPPEWATFASEGHSLTTTGDTRCTGLFYWSEEQTPGEPLKTLRRWPILPAKHPMAGDPYWTACPYGKRGDRLWVRETWQGPMWEEGTWDPDTDYHSPKYCEYRADGGPTPEYVDFEDNLHQGWKPSIHMPRWASRITLEITGVRVERLNDISEADAAAEGVPVDDGIGTQFCRADNRQGFRHLWESINGAESWNADPWVWVVEFKKVPAAELGRTLPL